MRLHLPGLLFMCISLESRASECSHTFGELLI